MTTKSVFPQRLCAYDYGTYVASPELAKLIWMRIRQTANAQDNQANLDHWMRQQKPSVMTWYATDLEVISQDKITLYVYEMADSFHGGIGGVIFETEVTEFTPKERKLLDKHILEFYTEAAQRELERRERQEYLSKVLAVRKELFGT